MRKIYLFLVLACCGLVACEASLNPNDKLDPIGDPVILEMEDLIAEQNGEFDDEELLDALYSSAIEVTRPYVLQEDKTWERDRTLGTYDYYYIMNNDGTYRRYSKTGFLYEEPYDKGYYVDTFTYDADSNTLSTTFSSRTYSAKVVYFKDDVLILEGLLAGVWVKREYVRYPLTINIDLRDELLNGEILPYDEAVKKAKELKNK